jgi:hypothetical protein
MFSGGVSAAIYFCEIFSTAVEARGGGTIAAVPYYCPLII